MEDTKRLGAVLTNMGEIRRTPTPVAREPAFFVKTGDCVVGPNRAGDTVVCEIDAIGRLSNPITP